MNLQIIILAAGQGKRMYSSLPKVLHPLAGKPMLTRVIETAQELQPKAIHIIYGHEGEQIKKSLSNLEVNWVHQAQQLGTGHAVLQALPHIAPDDLVLILSGDVPLIQTSTLKALIACEQSTPESLALLVAKLEDPTGLGRILRSQDGHICSIIEEKDASEVQKKIPEIYTGICCAKGSDLALWLPELSNNNAQGEFYLTEIIDFARANSTPITAITIEDPMEIQGVNNKLQLQQLERIFQFRTAERLLKEGVMIVDATRFDLRGELRCEQDVFIDVNCIFTGTVILGKNCIIGPNCILSDVTLGEGCVVLANSVLEGSHLDRNCHIGPFARLRAGTDLAADCKIGNFVETKKAQFGKGSKASHLSYLGDVTLGKEVNIGAGTITCNYDGVNKHKTVIGDGAFIGSDTQLIAPITVGAYATIGAGTTLRKDAPAGELTLSDKKQKTIPGWKRPSKEV